MRARQTRFLLLILGGWLGSRIYLLWPSRPWPTAALATDNGDVTAAPFARTFAQAAFQPWRNIVRIAGGRATGDGKAARDSDWDRADRRARMLMLAMGGPEAISTAHVLRRANFASVPADAETAEPPPAAAALFPPAGTHDKRWRVQTYVFVRPGGSHAALGNGELGGSQVAARVAWRPSGSPLGLAARVYAPLGHRGAEAAAGIDWYPVAALPLRLSVERRQRLEIDGRDAWSLYAASGFYHGGRPGAMEIDGYGQAGVVGARRRDGFVDGALRIGYRMPVRTMAPVLGVGLWGAAQPGAARIDIGPRASVRVPLADHLLTVALDGRFRVAGHARPGSGAALTIAADF